MMISKPEFFALVLASCESEAERTEVTENEAEVSDMLSLVADDAFLDIEDDGEVVEMVAAHALESVRLVIAQKARQARLMANPIDALNYLATTIPHATSARLVKAAAAKLLAGRNEMLDEFFKLNYAGSSPEMMKEWRDKLSDADVEQITKGMKVQEKTDKSTDLFKSVASLSASTLGTHRRGRMLTAATAKEVSFLKAMSRAVKVTDFDVNEVVPLLDSLDPGWKVEVKPGLVLVKHNIFDFKRDDLKEQFGISATNIGGPAESNLYVVWFVGGKDNLPEPSKATIDAASKYLMTGILSKVTIDKNPQNAEPGVYYLAAMPKPKLERRENPWNADDPGSIVVEIKLGSIKQSAPTFVVTDPAGASIVLKDADGATFWPWVYKHDQIKKLATERLAAPETKHAMAKVSTNKDEGSCPVCANVQKVRNGGRMVLHGYTRPGYGWIQGACFGVNYPRYEDSNEGCIDYKKELSALEADTQRNLGAQKARDKFHLVVRESNNVELAVVEVNLDGQILGELNRKPVMRNMAFGERNPVALVNDADIEKDPSLATANARRLKKAAETAKAGVIREVEQKLKGIGEEIDRINYRIEHWSRK